jgi:hypothetical protein
MTDESSSAIRACRGRTAKRRSNSLADRTGRGGGFEF